MSTMSTAQMSNPDRNLATSFVALSEGVKSVSNVGSRVEPANTSGRGERETNIDSDGVDTDTVRATVESTPVNEFTHLAQILSNAFPIEFPFGVTPKELGSTGTVLKRVLRRLTRVYDGRVAHNYILLMYVANLVYRHSALAATSARVNMESSGAVVDIVNHPDWEERARSVANNPTGPEAKELIKQIAPLVRLAGKKVPWSPMERLSASYHIYSLYHVFGAPSFFVTFSPKVLTNQLMLKFGEMQHPDKTIDFTLPEHLQHRVQLLATNTIAQARAYELMLDAVMSILFGIKSEYKCHRTHMPKPGLFGVPTAYYGVTECQARNALHAHFVIWVRTFHPDMLQRIAHDDDLRQLLSNAIDAIVTASTENFEDCVSQKKVICKFKSKPYGIRYQPTRSRKSVELKSVVFGSRASRFSLSAGMRIVSFAGKNVREFSSEKVRDMIKCHNGPVTIVFERETIFDARTGRLKKGHGKQSSVKREKVSMTQSEQEVNGYVQSGSVASTFYPPWIIPKKPTSKCVDASSDDIQSYGVNVNSKIKIGKLTSDVFDPKELNEDSITKGCDEGDTISDGIDHLTCTAFEEDIVSTQTPDEVYSQQDMLQDNILDQDFDATRLSVGDVFYDGNNGDTCDIEGYTLGWVEVVGIHKRSVYLSPIYSPQQRPFVPKSLDDLPVQAREDVISSKNIESKRRKLPVSVIQTLRSRNCWEWDERLANKAAALSRLRVRGQIVMSAYNVHGFANGGKQRQHSHRCHKYKDTYRAKWCALGFGRTVFNNTDLRQVISKNNMVDEKNGDSDCDDDEKDKVDDEEDCHQISRQKEHEDVVVENLDEPNVDSELARSKTKHSEAVVKDLSESNAMQKHGGKQSKYDELVVESLPKPTPPPKD